MKVEGDKLTGSIEKFFPDALKAKLKERLGVEPGDLLLFVADKEAVVCDALGALRRTSARAQAVPQLVGREAGTTSRGEAAKKEKRARSRSS